MKIRLEGTPVVKDFPIGDMAPRSVGVITACPDPAFVGRFVFRQNGSTVVVHPCPPDGVLYLGTRVRRLFPGERAVIDDAGSRVEGTPPDPTVMTINGWFSSRDMPGVVTCCPSEPELVGTPVINDRSLFVRTIKGCYHQYDDSLQGALVRDMLPGERVVIEAD